MRLCTLFFLPHILLLSSQTETSLASAFSLPAKASSTNTNIMSTNNDFMGSIPEGPPDAILGIAAEFRACTSPEKVNVCVGAYRDSDGKPWVLPSVRSAEQKMLESNVNKEYSAITGDPDFVSLALKFAYGESSSVLSRLAGVQTLSGTGACRIGGEFYARFLPAGTRIYVPDPTWGNHLKIFKECGLDVRKYRYYDAATNLLDYAGMMEDLADAPSDSVVLLHGCAHNPTGWDPTMEQWTEISDLLKEKKLHPFFDSAYQGFASGDAEKDAQSLRLFVERGHKVALAQSFAKNFGLYGERCGTLSFVCKDTEEKNRVLSQLKLIIRPMYSSPPIHGSGIVKTVLSDEHLKTDYYKECKQMADRIGSMRKMLVTKLESKGSTHDWSHVTQQIGMFAYTGMSKNMCEELMDKHFIFLTKDGRVSLAGLNENNIDYVAAAIHSVTDGKSITN